MRHRLTTLLLSIALCAHAAEPWKLHLDSKEDEMTFRLDLHEESISLPGLEMFGPTNGYLAGNGVFGMWIITSFEIESDKKATLRISNDQGSETQGIWLTQQGDSTYLMELLGPIVMKRRTANRKLVKIPQKITFRVRNKEPEKTPAP